MSCGKKENNCLGEVLELILALQQGREDSDIPNGCSRPFLGNGTVLNLNTRPITLYSCCNNKLWTMPATFNCGPISCTVFRIESLCDECATFRCLTKNPDTANTVYEPYVATDDFFTIDLKCVGAMKCLPDTNVCGI